MKDYGRVVIERFPGTTISDQVKATLPENDRSKPLEIILLPKSDQETQQSPQENQKLPKIIAQLFEKNNSSYFPGSDQLSRLYEFSSFSYHDMTPAQEIVEVGGDHDRNTLSWQTPLHYIASNSEKVSENYSDITDKISLFNWSNFEL